MKTHRILATAALFLGAVLVSSAADAKANWDEHCAKCHGAEGKGDTKMGKKLKIMDLSDAKAQAGFTDEAAAKAVKEGVQDKTGKVTMKAVEGLTDDDIKALVAHVRSLKK
jgi:cytochrome c553